MNIEIANRLYEYRKQHNLSQEELASRIGVSRQAVSKWERAESSPDTDNLIELAKLYGISLDDLLFTDTSTQKDPPPEAEPEEKAKDYVSVGLGGIHIKEGNEEVHISLKGGIHVVDDEDEVHVSLKDGIRISSNGEVEFDSEEWAEKFRKRWYFHLPVALFTTAAYLVMGTIWDMWHPGWLVFMAIPMFYQLLEMIHANGVRRKLDNFPMALLCTTAYLVIGFWWDLWHPGWVIFLAIPLYHSLVCLIPKTPKKEGLHER